MANKTKKKWYGIRTIDGDRVNIYTENWQDCEAKIKGHNCEYKGFTTFEDCMNYLSDSKELKEFNENEKIEGLIAYTDGSWDKSGLFSWCSLFIKDDVIIDILYGAEVDTCTSRQIQGELMASTKAMEKAISMKYKKMTIVHDYLGIDRFYAKLLPTQKAEILESIMNEGHKVAFVGDGINDAPALIKAHSGIGMCKGADIAKASADIVLLKDDIESVADAREFALACLNKVNKNFKITVVVNSAILALATFGKLSPIQTAFLHNGTTIGLLLNALRGITVRKR